MNSLLRILSSTFLNKRPGGGESTPRELEGRRLQDLRSLEERLGYSFRSPAILDRALTHKSFVNSLANVDRSMVGDYENLEFLGDAVLDLLISEYLLQSFPERPEGELTKMRAYLVSTDRLQRLSEGLGLSRYLLLSRGEEKTGGRKKRTILADLFESVVAAIYLDGGLEAARSFVLPRFQSLFEELSGGSGHFENFKSQLQEMLHAQGGNEPQYRVVEETGPDHDKRFVVEATVNGQLVSRGVGKSKKAAEQEAAAAAISELKRSTS